MSGYAVGQDLSKPWAMVANDVSSTKPESTGLIRKCSGAVAAVVLTVQFGLPAMGNALDREYEAKAEAIRPIAEQVRQLMEGNIRTNNSSSMFIEQQESDPLDAVDEALSQPCDKGNIVGVYREPTCFLI